MVKRYKWYKYLGSVELTSTYNYHHHRPPHSASCPSAKNTICASGWMQTPPAQVAEGDTTLCKWTICSSVCTSPKKGNTTSARCKGQNARCKGQGTRCKGQGQHQRYLVPDAAATCMQLQPSPPPTDRTTPARCSNLA